MLVSKALTKKDRILHPWPGTDLENSNFNALFCQHQIYNEFTDIDNGVQDGLQGGIIYSQPDPADSPETFRI